MSTEGKRRKLQEVPDLAHNGPDSTHTCPGPAHHGLDPTHTEPGPAHHGPNLSLGDRVSAFSDWCSGCGIVLSDAVYISTEQTAAQYGVLSRRDLAAGEVVVTIPRSALLSQHSTRIQDLLEKDGQSLASDSGWVPLLLSLMYEATDRSSPWAPYFELWPQLVPPDLPMFWTEEERAELLAGTGVMEAVSRDLENIQREYQTIVLPFIQRHPQHFHPHTHTLNLYMRLVAFVMAYSFQESEDDEEEDCGKDVLPPMMVPVADLFNHVAQHNTHLEYTPECLKMVTIKPVPAGAELFNTYGQMGNWQLLHMYGFSEPYPHNINESADIQMSVLREAALQGAESEEEKARMWARWSFLCRMEMVGEEGAFVFTSEEVLTDDELKTSLKVLCMTDEEFAEYKENDGWEEDDGDEDEETFTFQKLAGLPSSRRRLLHNAAALAMKAYATPLHDDQCLLDDAAEYAKLNSRAKYSLHVRYGQKRILQQLMALTTS